MATKQVVEERRKRLSIGLVSDAPDGGVKDDRPENPRGMINFLKEKKILDLAEEAATRSFGADAAQAGNARRQSVHASGSSADRAKHKQNSFDDKPEEVEGNAKMMEELGVGIKCKKGLKPEAPNQDSYTFVHFASNENDAGFDLYGVFDGHGVTGHDVSNFVRQMLPSLILTDPNLHVDMKKAFQNAFTQCQLMLEGERSIDSRTSGTTATVAMIERRPDADVLHVAHCGDSRAILVCENAKGKVFGHPLTRDHKPDIPEEKKRIESSGGQVVFDGFYNHRVFKKGATYPGLNMSRAMGDTIGHKEAGISCEPDVKSMELKKRSDGVEFKALVLCSDGVWEFISDDMAADMISKIKKPNGKIDPVKAAERICQESWDKWMEDTGNEISDDITCLIQVLGQS